MRLPFAPEAAEELQASVQFYERERRGYGRLFLREVSKKVSRAADFPRSGRRVPETPDDQDVRLFVVGRFPYSVVTAIVASQRAVVAVAHHRRRPGYWRQRVR